MLIGFYAKSIYEKHSKLPFPFRPIKLFSDGLPPGYSLCASWDTFCGLVWFLGLAAQSTPFAVRAVGASFTSQLMGFVCVWTLAMTANGFISVLDTSAKVNVNFKIIFTKCQPKKA